MFAGSFLFHLVSYFQIKTKNYDWFFMILYVII